MTTNETIETAIQGYASTRDAIRWAIEQEREACAQIAFAAKTYLEATAAIRARGQAIEQAEKPEAQRHISYVCPNCHWSLDRLSQQEQTRSEKLLEAGYTRRSKGWSKDELEPVAWREIMGKWKTHYYDYNEDGRGEPLYTAPPKRQWVGLTEEEIRFVINHHNWVDDWCISKFAQKIQAKLKEKNGAA